MRVPVRKLMEIYKDLVIIHWLCNREEISDRVEIVMDNIVKLIEEEVKE